MPSFVCAIPGAIPFAFDKESCTCLLLLRFLCVCCFWVFLISFFIIIIFFFNSKSNSKSNSNSNPNSMFMDSRLSETQSLDIFDAKILSAVVHCKKKLPCSRVINEITPGLDLFFFFLEFFPVPRFLVL